MPSLRSKCGSRRPSSEAGGSWHIRSTTAADAAHLREPEYKSGLRHGWCNCCESCAALGNMAGSLCGKDTTRGGWGACRRPRKKKCAVCTLRSRSLCALLFKISPNTTRREMPLGKAIATRFVSDEVSVQERHQGCGPFSALHKGRSGRSSKNSSSGREAGEGNNCATACGVPFDDIGVNSPRNKPRSGKVEAAGCWRCSCFTVW